MRFSFVIHQFLCHNITLDYLYFLIGKQSNQMLIFQFYLQQQTFDYLINSIESMKASSAFLIIASITLSLAQQCKQVFYDHYILALTWPKQFCTQNQCRVDWKNMWNGKSFTIHGFWPSSTDLSYLSCQKDTLHDPNCHHPFSFSQSLFSKPELSDLNTYWPKLGQKNDFWGYEWKKHGTCYLQIIKDEFSSPKSVNQIFKSYFLGTVGKVKQLNLSLKPGKIDSKISLAKLLNLHSSEFYAICGRDSQLDQIRICYDVDQNPGYEPIMSCPKSTDRSQCKFPIVIK